MDGRVAPHGANIMDTGRALLGTVFVTIGVLVLLDQRDVVDAGRLVADWWPAVFLGAALLDLLARPRRVVSAMVFGVLGVVLLGITTDVVEPSVWEIVWPIGIVGIGLWLLLRRPVGMDTASGADETIDVTVLFSGRRAVCTAPRFRGGSATAVFGGAEIDLSGAVIEGEAVLDAVALFGGVDVEVPLGWRVVLDGPAIFGGHESHVPPPQDPNAPTLRVRATAIFGGVEVKLGRAVTAPGVPAASG